MIPRFSRLAALLAAVLVAACSAPQPDASSAPTLAPDSPSPAATAAPTTAPSPPATASVAEPTVALAANPTSEAQTVAAVPSGKTPEGYNYLGDPDAPVTLQDYSDFL